MNFLFYFSLLFCLGNRAFPLLSLRNTPPPSIHSEPRVKPLYLLACTVPKEVFPFSQVNANLSQKDVGKKLTVLQGFTRKGHLDFPGGPVVKNLSCNEGDAGSIPGQGTKIPHAVGQLSPRAAMKDPACRNEDPMQPKK